MRREHDGSAALLLAVRDNIFPRPWYGSPFHESGDPRQVIGWSQFRTVNRFTLFLELLLCSRSSDG
jgi:hypothetical protein